MSTTQGLLQTFMADDDGAWALATTAAMFGLPQDTVVTIVEAGVPLLARMAEANPALRRLVYAATRATLPVPTRDFYAHMGESVALRQAAMDDYRATYGTMLDAVQRAAGKAAGTTDGQAREVLAAVLPALTQAMGNANASGAEAEFRAQLQALRLGPGSIT